jgi:hypothetical protein
MRLILAAIICVSCLAGESLVIKSARRDANDKAFTPIREELDAWVKKHPDLNVMVTVYDSGQLADKVIPPEQAKIYRVILFDHGGSENRRTIRHALAHVEQHAKDGYMDEDYATEREK